MSWLQVSSDRSLATLRIQNVGLGSPNGSGQSSLLHEEFRGECSTPATLETLGHSWHTPLTINNTDCIRVQKHPQSFFMISEND
jgi:hypothetical protein